MSSPISRAGPRQRLPWLGDWLRGERASWLFVLKSLLAFYIAAWLAMRLELEQPGTTMITVALVMHPHSGMVLAKSFYRALGTCAGCLFSLLLMGLFPQQRVLFLLCLSLWVGLCAGGATLYRNFMSYGFVLAGYTAAMVALPTVSHPTGVFDSAVMRVSEVLLGILVAGVISDTVLPTRVGALLRASAQTQFAQFIDLVHASADGKLAREDIERAQLNFVSTAVRWEDLRSTVIFEDAEARARSGRMRLLNYYYMAAASSFQSLHWLLDRMRRGGREQIAESLIALYQPLGAAVADEAPARPRDPVRLAPRLDQARAAMPDLAARLHAAHADQEARIDFDAGASLLLRFTDELRQFVRMQTSLRERRLRGTIEKVDFQRGNDMAAAAVAVLRTSLTMIGLAIWWIISAWPYGSGAMLIAVIFSGLFATSPVPLSGTLRTWCGYALGMLVSAVVTLGVLPMVDGYPLLVAASLPALMLGPYLVTHPRSASLGVGYMLGYLYIMALRNPMVYDPVRFANDGLAQLVGVAMTGIAFIFIPRVTGSAWQRRRQAIQLRRQVVIAARGPLRGLAARFESVSRDLLQQVMAHASPDGAEARDLLAWSRSVNESGRALIELRHRLVAPTHAPDLRAATAEAIRAVAALYDTPDADRWRAADQAVNAACEQVIAAAARGDGASRGLLPDLRLLRDALRDDDSALAAFMPTRPAAPPEVPDAP